MPRVSVIIPSFNRENLLGATLDSLRAQTYRDWECLLVDDDSKDNSLAVARRYAAEDPRFRPTVRQGTHRGANVCRNQGLARAAGDYIVFLDSDDLLLETCLERRVADMDASPDCGFGVYQAELFYERVGDRGVLWNAYTETSDLYRFLSKDLVWHTTGPIWRHQALVRLGGFDQHLMSFHDWDLHVRALIAGVKYFKRPLRDYFYRNGSWSASAISTVSCSHPDHLRSHEGLFAQTLSQLEAAALLDDEARRRMAGLFWWLAMRWQVNRCNPDADRVWRQAYNSNLCGHLHYLEGRLIFRLRRIRGGGRLSSLIQLSWPRHLARTGSKHFLNATPAGRSSLERSRAAAPGANGPVVETARL